MARQARIQIPTNTPLDKLLKFLDPLHDAFGKVTEQ